MRLNTAHFPPELTLRDLHLSAGDYVFASRYGDVRVKYCGTSWIVVWRDAVGVARQVVKTTDADAYRCARRLQEFGVLPVERKERRTIRGLQAIELGKVG